MLDLFFCAQDEEPPASSPPRRRRTVIEDPPNAFYDARRDPCVEGVTAAGIYYRCHGDPKAAPPGRRVLMIQGLSASCDAWEHLLRALVTRLDRLSASPPPVAGALASRR